MDQSLLDEARALTPRLCALRHALHRRPELGNREFETAQTIERALREAGLETRRYLQTAVIGLLRGALPGPVVALRADMDALPLQEATGAPFASQNEGAMHACGHDIHMTAALGAAFLLSARKNTLRGQVLFVFQPDEEGSGGAQRLMDAGALEGVQAIFGAHVSPDLPEGCVGFRFGSFYAASETFDIVFHGRSAHGATPELGADALAAAARTLLELRALPQREAERCVVTTGALRGGSARNIVCDRAELQGIARCFGETHRARLKALIEQTAERCAREASVRAEVHLHDSYPGVINDAAMTDCALRAARALLGEARTVMIDAPTMTTEDFGCYLQTIPGSFYHFGVGGALPLHHPAFLPSDAVAVTGSAVHAAVLMRAMEVEVRSSKFKGERRGLTKMSCAER